MQFAKINLLVRDVGSAVEYVRGTLGGEVLTAQHAVAFGEVAIVRVAGLVMEIIQPTPGSPMAATIERRGEGIDSVGFVTGDVGATAGEMEARGARLVRPTAAGMADTAWVHPKNPLSMSIEFFAASASEIFRKEAPGLA